ncbi:MAG: 50S ribosomal protein L24 [Candidatus Krumholzibacteriota bacterium]|nr:50S ribosomal protein L24 [Candidatus Krumholzibacteriota bacterium]
MRIKKNDTVRVISGNSKGMEGKVLKVFPDTNRVIVEKVKLIKRHTRQASQQDQGGIIEKEAPIDASKVILVCPKCNKPARTSMARLANGRKVRKCKKCGETLSDEE